MRPAEPEFRHLFANCRKPTARRRPAKSPRHVTQAVDGRLISRRKSPAAQTPRGLCVSSGVVEAGCKQIGDRLKRAGMRWTVAGANAIIALRCCILSGRFEDFWERRAANAA